MFVISCISVMISFNWGRFSSIRNDGVSLEWVDGVTRFE